MLAVRADTAAGQSPPEAEGRAGLVALHPLRRPVARGAVLEAEDQSGCLVVAQEFVVPEIR
jgi:hypothetical protein